MNPHHIIVMAVIATGLATASLDTWAAPRAPRTQTGPDAEVSFDGLHRVDRAVMDAAWADPTLDLTGYSKLMLGSFGISYREVEDSGRYTRSATEFPISDDGREQLRETVREVFLDEIEKLENWELVNEPGRDVLLLVAGLIDVVSAVPPEPVGRGEIYLTRVGEATLVLELRDSLSNQVLARSADRRAAESAFPMAASPVATWSAVRRLAGTWGRILVNPLDQLANL